MPPPAFADHVSPGRARPTAVAQVQPAETPGVQGLLTLAVGVVVVGTLYLAREVLVPITLAVLLSFTLAPLVGLLRRARLGRVPAALMAVVVALGVISAIGVVIGTQLAQLADDLPEYRPTIEQKLARVRGYTTEQMAAITRQLGQSATPAPPAPSGRSASPAKAPPTPVEMHQPDPTPLQVAQSILSPVVGPLATLGVVLIVAVFILLQQEDLRDRLIRLFGSGDLHKTTATLDDAARRLSRYFLTQLAINATFGVVIAVGLLIIGVPNPILWGIFATLLRFVPYLGTFLSVSIPALLAAAVDPGWSTLIWTLALFAVAEIITGQIIEPILYGHSTGLSPLSVVLAAIFWTWIWGPIGLILSMPLTLCLVVLGRHIDRLAFLDVLLGDQPALTPVESFYQRMLAGDADEALHQAETLLKRCALSTYYDEVALPGLRLAAQDTARGVLTPEQLGQIKEAVEEMVEDLADYADATPDLATAPVAPSGPPAGPRLPGSDAEYIVAEPPHDPLPEAWLHDSPVLCLAGRGPLDEAAAAMLAQVFAKNGIGIRAVPHDLSSRAGITELDVTGVALVCISYLETGGNPSALRYLVRRVRRRMAGVPVMVGLWDAGADVIADERLRAMIDADHYAQTLREALAICIDVARRTEAARPAAVGVAPTDELVAPDGQAWAAI
jgi:predicted PurR-regulated permease PerM